MKRHSHDGGKNWHDHKGFGNGLVDHAHSPLDKKESEMEPKNNSVLSKLLLSPTDAAVWAEEFLKVVEGPSAPTIDFGLMLGWFANAIETGRAEGRKENQKNDPLETVALPPKLVLTKCTKCRSLIEENEEDLGEHEEFHDLIEGTAAAILEVDKRYRGKSNAG